MIISLVVDVILLALVECSVMVGLVCVCYAGVG